MPTYVLKYMYLIGPKIHTLFLQPGKESKHLVGEIWCHLENAIIDLKTDPIKTTILGQEVEIYCDIEATQVWILCFEFSLIPTIFSLTRETENLSNFTELQFLNVQGLKLCKIAQLFCV